MDRDGKLSGDLTSAEDLDAGTGPIGQADAAQRRFVHASAIFEDVERFHVDRDVGGSVAGIVKTALGDAADERHLAAFETDADGTAGTGGLALATAAAGFSMTAGFALAEPLAAVLGPGTGFKIV
jgi:hypothetical protein